MINGYTVDEVMAELESQLLFFRQSGGGVTYSGGECTMQHDFLKALSDACYDMGLNQAIETSGQFDFETTWPILEKMDLVFMDIKHMDTNRHKYFTGIGNEKILANIAAVGERHDNVVIRIPTIIGVNADVDNIKKTARFVKEHMKHPKMELLPYHEFGLEKYRQLGLRRPDTDFKRPTPEQIRCLEAFIRQQGVEVVSFK